MSVNSLVQPKIYSTFKININFFNRVFTYLNSLMGFLKSLESLSYKTLEDGTVLITHTVSGSSVAYRADGNIDVYSARNHRLNTKGQLLLNCTENLDV